MPFSEKVKYVRKKLYLSQVNRWENGKTVPNLMLEGKFNDFCRSKGIEFNEYFFNNELPRI